MVGVAYHVIVGAWLFAMALWNLKQPTQCAPVVIKRSFAEVK